MREQKTRELADLYVALGILMLVLVYHIGANVVGGVNRILHPDTAALLSHGLFIWLMGMLLIAYRRWRGVSQTKALLDDIFAGTGQEVMMVLDAERIITLCNGAVRDVFGYEIDEVVGRPAHMLFGDDRSADRMESEIRGALQQVGFYREELPGRKKTGEGLVIEVATADRKEGEGRVLIVRDITERKEYELRLRLAKEHAEAEKAAKEEALAKLEQSYQRLRELEIHRDNLIQMVCHDMKAPLQVLILQLDILKDMILEKLDNDELESVDTLLAYSRQLEIMVHSMLDLSKLESGKLPLRLKDGELSSVIGSALEFVRTLGKDCRFILEGDDDPPRLSYDPEVMQRILVNLLLNAIKYSPGQGEIRVRVRGGGGQVRLEVSDQGPGIPEAYQETIFEKFGQVKIQGHERRGSTGLGLTFCRMAVEAHGGRIGVESEEGKGSTFWLTVPVEAVEPECPEEAAPTEHTSELQPSSV